MREVFGTAGPPRRLLDSLAEQVPPTSGRSREKSGLPTAAAALERPPNLCAHGAAKVTRITLPSASTEDAENSANFRAAQHLAGLWPQLLEGNEFAEEMQRLGKPWVEMWSKRMAERFEARYLHQVRRSWVSWTAWLRSFGTTDSPTSPSALSLATWLDTLALQGHSVVRQRLAHLKWM